MTEPSITGDDELQQFVRSTRRALHRIPELMYNESGTAQYVKRQLSALGISYTQPSRTHGIVAYLGSAELSEPCVALRADMDALPIHEQNELPSEYQSDHPGLMHACGHDSHMAMLLGACKVLKEAEQRGCLHGTVKAVFTPAEEGGAGAKVMLDDAAFDGAPKTPDASFALHVWPYQGAPTGTLLGKSGTLMAASGMLYASIAGTGGHAALPHRAIDPVPAAAAIINALQTLVSREANPVGGARVVSVTQLQSHTSAANVLPASVELGGTFRALSANDLHQLGKRIRTVIESVAAAYNCNASVNLRPHDREPYPALHNDQSVWQDVQAAANGVFGQENVMETDTHMVAEDFAFVAQQIPSAMVLLGIRNESAGSVHPLHSPHFMLDESALTKGVALHAAFAQEYISKHSSRNKANQDEL